MNKALILMVEDDKDIMRANRKALELEGYRVLEADTLAKGRTLMASETPDLILLDILMPDGNGLEYCQELRGNSGVRILFLSALSTREDSHNGFRAGGDDYITKPYDMDDLIVRVEALLRRGKLLGQEEAPLRIGMLELDFTSRRAFVHGKDLMLMPREFAILEKLVHNRDKYLSSAQLYESVWGLNALGDVRTVRVRIAKLRKKLQLCKTLEIQNCRGMGYRLHIRE